MRRGFQRVGCQVAHLVTQGGGVFTPGILDGGLELGRGSEPVVNGGSVQSGLTGHGADGESLGKGGDDLGLSGRQVRRRET